MIDRFEKLSVLSAIAVAATGRGTHRHSAARNSKVRKRFEAMTGSFSVLALPTAACEQGVTSCTKEGDENGVKRESGPSLAPDSIDLLTLLPDLVQCL
jgi:hypothetical protein